MHGPHSFLVLIGLLVLAGSGCGRRDAADVPAERTTVTLGEVERREGGLFVKGSTNPFSGVLRDPYPDGSLKAEAAMRNGLLHGRTAGYGPGGRLQAEEFFENGVAHGPRRRFDPEGRLLSLENIVQGQLQGLSEKYYPDGRLMEQGYYLDGVPHGVARRWGADGELQVEIEFDRGEIVRQNLAQPTQAVSGNP